MLLLALSPGRVLSTPADLLAVRHCGIEPLVAGVHERHELGIPRCIIPCTGRGAAVRRLRVRDRRVRCLDVLERFVSWATRPTAVLPHGHERFILGAGQAQQSCRDWPDAPTPYSETEYSGRCHRRFGPCAVAISDDVSVRSFPKSRDVARKLNIVRCSDAWRSLPRVHDCDRALPSVTHHRWVSTKDVNNGAKRPASRVCVHARCNRSWRWLEIGRLCDSRSNMRYVHRRGQCAAGEG